MMVVTQRFPHLVSRKIWIPSQLCFDFIVAIVNPQTLRPNGIG